MIFGNKISNDQQLFTSTSSSVISRTPLQQDTDVGSNVPSRPEYQRHSIHTEQLIIASDYLTTEVLLEDENIIIHGETPFGDDERDSDNIPIRLLEDVVIYDLNSLEAVPLARLLKIQDSKHAFSASGLVKPWIEEDSDDEGDSEDTENEADRFSVEPQWDRLSLSRIREFSVHSPSSNQGRLDEYVAHVDNL
jgi:hypothetical protein